jgi:hypothetical protein
MGNVFVDNITLICFQCFKSIKRISTDKIIQKQTESRTFACVRYKEIIVFLSLSLSLSHTQTHSVSLSHTHTQSLFLSHTQLHSDSLDKLFDVNPQ